MCYVCLTVGLRVLTSAMDATTGAVWKWTPPVSVHADCSYGYYHVLSRTDTLRLFTQPSRAPAAAARPLICCLCSTTGALLAYFCIFNLGPLPCILCAAMLLVGSCMDVLLLTCCSLYLCSLSVLSALLPGSTCASSSLRHGVVVRRETLCVRWLSALLPLIPVCVLHSAHISSQLGFFLIVGFTL